MALTKSEITLNYREIKMKQEIKHRRLYAFFNSKALNVFMFVIIVCLLVMAYTGSMLMPVICGLISLAFFAGYSLWLWIRKPESIVVNGVLSNANSAYMVYYLAVAALYPVGQWWLIVPIALSVVVIAVCAVGAGDRTFKI